MTIDLDALLDVARAVAAECAALLETARPARIGDKTNANDLVTEWDTRCEALIRARLAAATPHIPVVGEEEGGDERAPRRWLVDPIDGTVNFTHGLPLWTVSIALEGPTGVEVGVVVAPALGWTFHARRGGGAYQEHRAPAGTAADRSAVRTERLHVSACDRVERAMLVTGFPYDRATHPENNFAAWEHFQRVARACRRLGAASLDLCFVAAGLVDGYWERRLHAWDIAAGALLVVEAGGIVTDTRGGPFIPSSGDVLASGGGIHDQLRAELALVAARSVATPPE